METAGKEGSRRGFGRRILSSAKNSSSRRFKDTFAFTTCKIKTIRNQKNETTGECGPSSWFN